jgi:RecB family exonuclease
MGIRRVFLDWRRPGLAGAAEFLLDGAGSDDAIDLSGTIVAVPGGRAGRRLLELLVERAEEKKLALVPPEITTVGRIPELLYRPQRPFAGDFVQQLAWAKALRGHDREALQAVIRRPPEDDDQRRWLDLGDMLRRLHTELAADGLDFANVEAAASQLGGDVEQRRWQVLGDVQNAYLLLLDDLKLWDKQKARLVAIANMECRTEKPIVLIGMVDVDRTVRQMLDQVADQVTAIIVAPESLAERFDPHGCVRPAAWRDLPIEVADDQIVVAGAPDEQADAVLRAIADFDGRYTAEEITVGVPDESLVPYVEQRLAECDLPCRYGVGRSVSRIGPYRLLEAAAEFLQGRRLEDFAALVRHPDIEAWLANRFIEADDGGGDQPTALPAGYLDALDDYHNNHLQLRLARRASEQPQLPGNVYQMRVAVDELLKDLAGKPCKLADWTGAIADVLTSVYGRRPLDRDDPADRQTLAACRHIREVLLEYREVDDSLAPTVSAAEAIGLVLSAAGSANIPPPDEQAAIELLGWLELPLDDAPALIVTGFNEGFVPKSVNNDLFLPNALRRKLGLLDNDRRWSRDAYALSVLLASKGATAGSELKLIVGRRTDAGDPLAPSRLLLNCKGPQLARRTLRLFADSPDETSTAAELPGRLTATRNESHFPLVPPAAPPQPITSLAVTRFRDYLACPYRFYLGNVLKLRGMDDVADELDGGSFGSLAHDVLAALGTDEDMRSCSDAERIKEYLNAELNRLNDQRFGGHPLPAVRVQIEQLRYRLGPFAEIQANWASAGWRIEAVECKVSPHNAGLDVDGERFGLSGRIDRIDRNEHSGEWIVFDYKTSETAKTPEQAHFKRNQGWVDLQLPLYRHMLRGIDDLNIDNPTLAYINLPKSLDAVAMAPAQWTEEELADADEAAREVIRGIRAGRFEIDPDYNFAYDDFAVLCGP